MGNEMSAESGAQADATEGNLTQLEPTNVQSDMQVCWCSFLQSNMQKYEESPKNLEDEMKPLHDAQLSRLMKVDSSQIDVYDTGMEQVSRFIVYV